MVERHWVYCSLIRLYFSVGEVHFFNYASSEIQKSLSDCLTVYYSTSSEWVYILTLTYLFPAYCIAGNFANCYKFHSDGRVMRQNVKLYEKQNSVPCANLVPCKLFLLKGIYKLKLCP